MIVHLMRPDGPVYSGHAKLVTLPGSDGEFGVMEGHECYASLLKKGKVTVDGKEYECKGGFVTVITPYKKGAETIVKGGI